MTTKINEQTELGKIDISTPIYVSLIPTIANSVIVKYDPDIQISCVIPPRDYEVTFNIKHSKVRKNINVKAPSLIMSCGYKDVPTPLTYKNVAHGYGLYVIDESKKAEIWAKPYLLANVWEHGNICFGSLLPGSLRQAFNYYWTSGFNADLLRSPHRCDKKLHHYDYHVGCQCLKQKTHQCDCNNEIFHNHYGCGCNTVAKSKKCKGTCGKESATSENKTCTCCIAITAALKKILKEKPGLSKTKIAALIKNPESGVGKITYPGCGCSSRHKKSCDCRLRKCNCPCSCECCLKTCSHQLCSCACCKGKCNCGCNCSELQKLTAHLTNYHDIQLKEQKWSNYTATFCGMKFWAAPKGADGVLVSNNRQLINNIPRKYWRKDRLGQPLIICLANKDADKWKFESGGYAFSMDEKYVITK